jgi:ATPase subunit of ABC transporter with duplicated ATPase domains
MSGSIALFNLSWSTPDGRPLFSQFMSSLSGGQLLRAGLACVLGGATPPSLLILDEPTNHLDVDAIEAVETGLRAYDGALLVVSHDEAFLQAIGISRRLELSPV